MDKTALKLDRKDSRSIFSDNMNTNDDRLFRRIFEVFSIEKINIHGGKNK